MSEACEHEWRYTGTDYHGSHKGEDHYNCAKCPSWKYELDGEITTLVERTRPTPAVPAEGLVEELRRCPVSFSGGKPTQASVPIALRDRILATLSQSDASGLVEYTGSPELGTPDPTALRLADVLEQLRQAGEASINMGVASDYCDSVKTFRALCWNARDTILAALRSTPAPDAMREVWRRARDNHENYSATGDTEQDIRFFALGLAGEAGEVANFVKKRWRDGDGHDDDLRKECADVFAYNIMLADALGMSPDDLFAMVAHKQQVFVAKMQARTALRPEAPDGH